jgi:protoporphyrinogen oxidase
MKNLLIIGTGPAGMGCADQLTAAGHPVTVIERGVLPGGLCRTINFHGYLFDIGGHRFLTKSDLVRRLWQDLMGPDLREVKRLSRIFYRRRFFRYPLSFINTFWNLGPVESCRCVGSYLRCRLTQPGNNATFEGWMTNHFGKRLYNIFFKTYTEKVWEVACRDISAEWAKQRIRGLSLRVAVQKALFGSNGHGPKTLSDYFLYPKGGPGELYRRMEVRAQGGGAKFHYGTGVVKIRHDGKKARSVVVQEESTGRTEEWAADQLFSSMPLPVLVRSLDPAVPGDVSAAAARLRFRSYIVVNVILDQKDIFDDQWIYVHSPDVKLGRIQNYKNWSADMVADLAKTSLGLEYFCNQGDELWSMNDVDLINFALKELEMTGIVSRRKLIDGFVVRAPFAYPLYSLSYQNDVKIIRDYLLNFSNLQTMGRNGLFRYCNSDHALLTGIYAARNFLEPAQAHDLWEVNADSDYLES